MMTRYGDIPDESVMKYFDRLIGQVWKILPLKESNSDTVDQYVSSLLRELIGHRNLFIDLQNSHLLVVLMSTLENIKIEDDHQLYRSDIFKCTNLIQKMIAELGGDQNGV